MSLKSVESSTTPAVDVTNVTCTFKNIRALDHFSLKVPVGTVLGIVGPNGAGKTTLIDTICGLQRPNSGTVRIFGEDIFKAGSGLRAKMGLLPQETALYEEVSALQNLRFAAALYDVPNSESRILEVLELVRLRDRSKDVVRHFSGGMQRRLALARALLHAPPLLILDEPTVGVDVETRHEIWAHVRSLRAMGRTIVLTTNYMDEAEALCDHMVILRQGQMVAEGSPASLLERTGQCLELTLGIQSGATLREVLGALPSVLRIHEVDFGLRLYLSADATPESILLHARQVAPIEGFRTRSPDLAEVFLSLAKDRHLRG